MAISPELQIRLLAQEINFHCVDNEALYVARLGRHGVDASSARDAYRFVQIALGRRLAAIKGIPFPTTFRRFDMEGRCVGAGALSNEALFVQAIALAGSVFTLRAARIIAMSSPEVRSAVAQMGHGIKAKDVRVRPCILFTDQPDAELVQSVTQQLDALSDVALFPSAAGLPWIHWGAGSMRFYLSPLLGR
jgi:hypothetical protein